MMKQLYLLIALTAILLTSNSANTFAQEHNHEECKFQEAQSAFWKAHPEAYQSYLKEQQNQTRLIHKMKHHRKSYNQDSETKYIIPVVFHVFGKEQGGYAVTTALIEDALMKLNQDYAQRSAGQSNIHDSFKGVLGIMPVEFRLAKIDPQGNMTNGITFHGVMSGFGDSSGADKQIQKYAWDNHKYMNVYIMNDLYGDGETNNSGVSWYPNEYMTKHNLARVVYNGAYLSTNTSENFRRVLTHEFGHFFNLAHTFQGGCPEKDGGDFCDDTPATNKSHMKVDELNCNGILTNTQNFMNYTDDYEMFTQDQVIRMKAAMQHPARITLWSEENLMATGVADTYVPSFGIGYGTDSFEERFLNDGIIENSLDITLLNGLHFKEMTWKEGEHYFVENLPKGLSLKITKSSDHSAMISLEGKAEAHEATNSIENLTIRFAKDIFKEQGQEISLLENSHIKIHFKDTYTQYHYPTAKYRAYAGITHVKFSTIDNESPVTNWGGFFKDHMAVVAQEKHYDLEITLNQHETGKTDSYIIHAWLDKNGDCLYTPDEEIVDHTMNFTEANDQGNYLYKQTIQIPQDMVVDKKVGLRILCAFNTKNRNTSGYDPQGNYESGELEDYSVMVLPSVTELTPDFTITPEKILLRHTIKVLDLSNASNDDEIVAWHWEFPGGVPNHFDGKNPSEILYEKVGTYDVSLNVTTKSGETKSLSKKGGVTVEEKYATPNTQYATYAGITRVKLGEMIHRTENMARYMDYHTQKLVTTKAGTELAYEIDLDQGLSGQNDLDGVHIWCDWNHNSEFDAEELMVSRDVEIASFTDSKYSIKGSFVVPIDASSEPSRIRAMVYYRGDKRDYIAGPSDVIESGEIEDYGLKITPSEEHASVDFTMNNSDLVVGNEVQFTDLSKVVSGYKIASYQWQFEEGTPAVSSEKNPIVTFNKEGAFDVRLTITLDNGETWTTKQTDCIRTTYKVCEVKQDWGTKFGHIQSVEVGKVSYVLPEKNIPAYTNLYDSHIVSAKHGDEITWRVICSAGESGEKDAIGFKVFFDADRNGFTAEDQIYYDHFNTKDVQGEQIFEGSFNVPEDFDDTKRTILRFVAYYEGTYWYKKFDVGPCDKLDSGNGLDLGIGSNFKSTFVLQKESQEELVLIYPNPVSHFLNLFSKEEAIQTVKIYDTQGVIYYQGKFHQQKVQLSLEDLSTGVYLIKVETGDHSIVRTVIKK
ncbi:PKD domain-containing protein [Halosquirtibacter laminarini]|uniref:PKD domain-containing protein n=1 Tax=Halosquirtibacter laminarini TaxID=3374600 RepID=A0AC61NCY2_9BACT|nr:PKD domain-containing protein [Prolixibacteraceae bacterium]